MKGWVKAPLPILAVELIAIYDCFAKAVEVAFLQLFFVNQGAGNLFEAGRAK